MRPSNLFTEQRVSSPLLKNHPLQVWNAKMPHISSASGPVQSTTKRSKLAQQANTERPGSNIRTVTPLPLPSPCKCTQGPCKKPGGPGREARSTLTLTSTLRRFIRLLDPRPGDQAPYNPLRLVGQSDGKGWLPLTPQELKERWARPRLRIG